MVQYRNKSVVIDAIQNTGTDKSAQAVVSWIKQGGGIARLYAKGSVQQDIDRAYVVIHEGGDYLTVPPGSWVYRYSNPGILFSCGSKEFQSMFERVYTLKTIAEEEETDE